jgi:hypothetical protein
MAPFFIGAKALLGNKLVQYGLMAAALALLVIGAINVAKGAYSDMKKGIREDVVQEFTIRDLQQALVDAEKDRKFLEEQAEKDELAMEELRGELNSMASRVGTSRTIIREQIASGELTNGQISPVQSATITQIDIMEQERRQREAANVQE